MLTSMDDMSGFDTPIVTDADLAFVYRPIILEGPSITCLVGWGDANMVRSAREWTKEQGENS